MLFIFFAGTNMLIQESLSLFYYNPKMFLFFFSYLLHQNQSCVKYNHKGKLEYYMFLQYE